MKTLLKKIIPFSVRLTMRYIQIKVIYFFKKGNKHHCPICNSNYNEFAEFNSRKNRMCPSCFSLERHRLLYLYLKNETKIFTGKYAVLHFAPEKCLHDVLQKNKKLNYQTADLMTNYIKMIGVKPKNVMSVCDIGFPDNTFDFIICNHVLVEVPDDHKALTELYRVLKFKGTAILQHPINLNNPDTLEDLSFDSSQRRQFYGSPNSLRLYGYEDYARRLENVGFKVNRLNYVSGQDIEKNLLDKDEILYLCKK